MENIILSNLYTEAALNLICLKGKGNKRVDIINLKDNIIYIEKCMGHYYGMRVNLLKMEILSKSNCATKDNSMKMDYFMGAAD